MFGWRWERFKHSVGVVAVAFLATIMSGGFAFGLLGNVRPEDAAGRVLGTTLLSAVIWLWAFFHGNTFAASRDSVLFYLTPLTPRRYYFRNARNRWTAHAYFLLGVPFGTWGMIGITRNEPIDPLIITCAFLAYYAVLLGPVAERLSGPWSPTRLLFLPRHLLRFGIAKVVVAVGVLVGSYFIAPKPVLDGLRSGAQALLDLGPAGLAIITAISPASGVAALVEEHAQRGPLIALCTCFSALIVWELRSIARAFTGSVQALEGHELESWLERRREWIEKSEEAADKESEALEKWSAKRATLAAESPPAQAALAADAQENAPPDGPSPDYDEMIAPEAQLLRHALYARKAPRVSGFFASARRNTWRIAWFGLTLIVVGRDFISSRPTDSLLPFFGVLALLGRASIGWGTAPWWEVLVRINLAVPVRVPRLAARIWWSRIGSDLLWDAIAIGLFISLTKSPLWTAAPLWFALQLVGVSGYVGTWILLTRRKGRLRDLSLYQCLELLVFIVAFASFASDWQAHAWMGSPGPYISLISALIVLLLIGAVILAWRHRRADMSLPRDILARWRT